MELAFNEMHPYPSKSDIHLPGYCFGIEIESQMETPTFDWQEQVTGLRAVPCKSFWHCLA